MTISNLPSACCSDGRTRAGPRSGASVRWSTSPYTPAAARAPAPPATNCLRVRRTSGLLRLDPDETSDHAVEVFRHVPVRQAQGRHDVLADGVERSAQLPRIEDVPSVGTPVHVVDLDLEARDLLLLSRVVEARAIVASRDRCPAGIAAEVYVNLGRSGLIAQEPNEIAAVFEHRVHRLPGTADLAGQGLGHPARAVHGCLDLVG